jgi:dipeptidase E
MLLSNSRNYGQGFLEHTEDDIRTFFGEARSIVFIPYAGVTVSFDEYTGMVRQRFNEMGYQVQSVHEVSDPVEAVENAEAITVGGGNTFQLLHHLYENQLVDSIRTRVTGGVPYIGWSAGSNVTCPSIKTTNDMPIIEPPRFDALGLVPFQINPHYLDANPEGHQGETREQRILEFIEVNPDIFVVGLREGSYLRVEDRTIDLLGGKPARVFKRGMETREIAPGDELNFLIR